MSTARPRALAPLAVLLLIAAPAAAQRPTPLSGGLTAATARIQRQTPSGAEELTGAVLGGEGRLRMGRVYLDLGYREGSLSGAAGDEDLVEGHALFGMQPAAWLTLLAGAQARAMIAGGGTTQWILPQARARLTLPLGLDAVRAQAEVWRALSVSTNTTVDGRSAAGGAASLRVQARSRVWLRLTYTVEHGELDQNALVETYETLSLAVGLGRRP